MLWFRAIIKVWQDCSVPFHRPMYVPKVEVYVHWISKKMGNSCYWEPVKGILPDVE